MKTILFSSFILLSFASFCQESEVPDAANLPQYPGELKEFYAYLNKNLVYPVEAKKKNLTGRVWIEFYVNSDGSIDKDAIKIVRGIDKECDEEAIRLIRESKAWIPGKRADKPSREKLVLYVPFVIESIKK